MRSYYICMRWKENSTLILPKSRSRLEKSRSQDKTFMLSIYCISRLRTRSSAYLFQPPQSDTCPCININRPVVEQSQNLTESQSVHLLFLFFCTVHKYRLCHKLYGTRSLTYQLQALASKASGSGTLMIR